MKTVNILYTTRVQEIEEYFKFLNIFNNTVCSVHYTDDLSNMSIQEQLSPEFFKILKANGFLLLYNLIEAVVEKSLDAVFAAINSENMHYSKSTLKIQNLCVKLHCSVMKEKNLTYDALQTEVFRVIDYFVKNNIITLEKKLLSGRSGNLDSRSINKISEELGIDHNADCSYMHDIKNKRNNLAHGDVSFATEGRSITYNQLEEYKKEVTDYLGVFIQNVNNFIEEKQYVVN